MGVLRTGELPNYDLMCDVVGYLCHFGARYHHAREDIAFVCIVQGNPAMSGTINRLWREHADIAANGEELDALLVRAVAGNARARAGIEDLLAAFLIAYRNHIAAEEQDILPYAVEHLSAAEWESVARAAPQGPDAFNRFGAGRHNPTFGSEADARYRALCERIRTGRSAHPGAPPVRRAQGHQENRVVGASTKSAAVLAVPRTVIRVSGVAAARRLLVRQAIELFVLIMAYLQYYYHDVQLQILSLPSVFPGPLQ